MLQERCRALAVLDRIADRYTEFAAAYYEIELDRPAVGHIVAHLPLTDAVARALNPEVTLADVRADTAAMGYPATPQ